MIGKSCGIGVVLLYAKVGFMVRQAVEHVGRVPNADIDHLGVKRRVLVGNVGVKQPTRLAAVLRVDVASALCLATGLEPSTIG